MKKTLIAVAALAATASFAQVSVYGRLDVGYGAYTTTAAGADTKRNGVSSHNSVSSMWGIKGSEDLGSGLKAFFILEQDVYTANGNTGASGANGGPAGSTGAFDRTSLVGVEGGFGKVAFGRDYTPMFKLIGSSDIHGLSNLSTVQSAGAAGGNLPNQMFYSTPNLSGFVGNLSLINTDTSTSGVGVSVDKVEGNHITGVYSNGPLMVGVGIGNTKTTIGGAETKSEAKAISAAYNFGTFALRGGYVASTNTNALGVATDAKETNIGATMPLGKVTLGLQVGRNDTGAAAVTGDTGTDMVLSADYALSAKTALYAKTGTVNKVGDNQKTTGTALGIKTVF